MSDKLLELEIVTPEKVVYKGKVRSVTVPGTVGSFQILYNHAPILSTLEVGGIKIVNDEGKVTYLVSSKGFVEVRDNVVSVLVDSVEGVERSRLFERIREKRKENLKI
jgi:F-type H+-transporting ATPase subunit epsilon